ADRMARGKVLESRRVSERRIAAVIRVRVVRKQTNGVRFLEKRSAVGAFFKESDPVEAFGRGAARSLLARLLRLVPQLHDVALGEEDALEHLAPLRLLAEEELEVHPEVLHLLVLRVLHDGLRLTVLLDGEALLIPADRFGLLDQRGDHAGKGARRGRELFGRLVVLVESHVGGASGGERRRLAAWRAWDGGS